MYTGLGKDTFQQRTDENQGNSIRMTLNSQY